MKALPEHAESFFDLVPVRVLIVDTILTRPEYRVFCHLPRDPDEQVVLQLDWIVVPLATGWKACDDVLQVLVSHFLCFEPSRRVQRLFNVTHVLYGLELGSERNLLLFLGSLSVRELRTHLGALQLPLVSGFDGSCNSLSSLIEELVRLLGIQMSASRTQRDKLFLRLKSVDVLGRWSHDVLPVQHRHLNIHIVA